MRLRAQPENAGKMSTQTAAPPAYLLSRHEPPQPAEMLQSLYFNTLDKSLFGYKEKFIACEEK